MYSLICSWIMKEVTLQTGLIIRFPDGQSGVVVPPFGKTFLNAAEYDLEAGKITSMGGTAAIAAIDWREPGPVMNSEAFIEKWTEWEVTGFAGLDPGDPVQADDVKHFSPKVEQRARNMLTAEPIIIYVDDTHSI